MNLLLRPLLSLLLLLSLYPATAQTNSPVGRWVSEHTSAGGIGSWWEFRADGAVTMSMGAVVTSRATHTADTVTTQSGVANSPPLTLNYKINGDTLILTKPGDPEVTFTRVGPPPTPSDPLLGRWRPNPPPTISPNPTIANYQKAMANGLYVFSPDNTQSVRIPLATRTGTWNSATHNFQMQNDTQTYSYSRTGTKLTLGQPPDNQKTDTYIPDPLFP